MQATHVADDPVQNFFNKWLPCGLWKQRVQLLDKRGVRPGLVAQ